MKKIVLFLLSILMIVSLVGCSSWSRAMKSFSSDISGG